MNCDVSKYPSSVKLYETPAVDGSVKFLLMGLKKFYRRERRATQAVSKDTLTPHTVEVRWQ